MTKYYKYEVLYDALDNELSGTIRLKPLFNVHPWINDFDFFRIENLLSSL